MGFQNEIRLMPRAGKQNVHLVGYVADKTNCAIYVKSSIITDGDGAIDRREVMQIILSKHSDGAEILLQSVCDLGLQDITD
ncbi:hypothetical protein [Acinetobacter pullicarnis]|uniref:hypothetical protein n=1 Tax=Acinetobacter pullicarnis TaxID=2576829 RepID=UPI001124AE49|nr:hypothetical protein [Acinetobacter pullicarnis]